MSILLLCSCHAACNMAESHTRWMQVLLEQQQHIVGRASDLEHAKAVGDSQLRQLTGTHVGTGREALHDESSAAAARLATEREEIIIDFRSKLLNLMPAFG